MAGENLPIISNRKIDIKSYVPEYLKYKSDGDFYEFIGVFENYLNGMYVNKTNSDQETLGILEKIESLKTLQDAWEIDFDYINHFAKFLGFQININTDDFSLNIFGKKFVDLDVAEQEIIKKHVRQFVKTLPSWYKIKSTKNSIRAMLYSFGLVSDIIEKYTLDYNSTGIDWIDVPIDDTQALPQGYYPTPHFGISIEVGNSTETIIISPGTPGVDIPGVYVDSFIGNGVDSYIYKPSVDSQGDTFSVMAIIQIEQMVSDGMVASSIDAQGASGYFDFRIDSSNRVKVYSNNTAFETGWYTTNSLTVGVPYTILVKLDLVFGGFKVLVNDTEWTLTQYYDNPPPVANPTNLDLTIGAFNDGQSRFFKGQIAELYWGSNPLIVDEATMIQYATGSERFTQIAPDSLEPEWKGGAVQGEIEIVPPIYIPGIPPVTEVIVIDATLPTWYNNISRLTDIVSRVRPINTVFDGFVSKFSVTPDFVDENKIQIRAKVFPYYGTYVPLTTFKSQYLLDEGFGSIIIGDYYISNAGTDNISGDLENYVAIDGQII